jgi:hypothetical protein
MPAPTPFEIDAMLDIGQLILQVGQGARNHARFAPLLMSMTRMKAHPPRTDIALADEAPEGPGPLKII